MRKVDVLNLKDSEFNKIVKIAGTDFDRRRKLDNKTIKEIQKLHKRKKFSISKLSKLFNVSCSTIKYHIDEVYKSRVNYLRTFYINNKVDNTYIKDLILYKKGLVATNQLKVK